MQFTIAGAALVAVPELLLLSEDVSKHSGLYKNFGPCLLPCLLKFKSVLILIVNGKKPSQY